MRKSIFLLAVLFLPVLEAQTFNPFANNTSACSASGTPTGCTSGYTAITTNPANTGAITVTTDPVPVNTNFSDLHSLMYASSTTPIYFHYQDWWGCSGHISIGKVGNNSNAIANEAAQMAALGGTGLIIDWAGNRDSSKACRLANTNAWASYLTANPGLKMGIMVDQSGFQNTCPTGATDQTTCITTELNAELDYVNTNYASQSWYFKDGGNPVVGFFIDEASWSGTNWNTVWSNVKAHTNLYSSPFKYIFENTQTHTQGNGGFAWMGNPVAYTVTAQTFWGDSASTTPTSYNNFYASCLSHPSNLCFGMGKKGFDDGIGFGGGFTGNNRVQSQRCGQTWLDTFNLPGLDGFSSSTQLGYLQVGPWNDYEEGTAIEMGIGNCFTAAVTQAGSSLNWTLTKTDSTYSTLNTIQKLQVLSGSSSTAMSVAIDNITPALTGSVNISAIPAGQTVILRALGKPGIVNTNSNIVTAGSTAAYSLPNDDTGCPTNCRQIPWKAGSDLWNGGTLPNYTSVTCTGLTANGTIGATTGTNNGPAIQACISALSNQQCAFIPAGTYFVNSLITIPSNKCLRGAQGIGPPFLPAVNSQSTTIVWGTAGGINATTGHSVGAQRTIASGYTKGSNTLVMNAGHGFVVGNWITISEKPDTGLGVTANGTGTNVCLWCGQDDSNGSTATYLMNQMVQVTGVSGNTITLSRPLYYTFQSTFAPVARTLGVGTTKGGVENIRFDGSAADRGRPFIDYENTSFMWVKGVETYMAGSAAKCGHLTMVWNYGTEVRDNYFHHGRSPASDRNYGIYSFLVNSDHKIENNIVRLSRHPVVQEGGGSGIVYLYNYTDDAQEDDPTFMAAASANHGAHPYMNLYEGNIFSHIIADNTWGSSSHDAFLRNSMWGDETQTPDISPKPTIGYWPLELWRNQNYYSFVGNVLGITGKWGNPNWASYTLINSSCATQNNMYELGCDVFNNAYSAVPNSTRILHGNYDMKTHGVAFWDGGSNHTLATSLYYGTQPLAWWKVGTYTAPWPGIGPDITGGNLSGTDGTVNQNPAYACFTGSTNPCYSAASGGGTTVATPSFSPTPGTYTSVQSVSLGTATPGATICYTVNGTAPTTNGGGTCTGSTLTYSAAITVSVTTTINAIGTLSGATDSGVASGTYTISLSPVASISPTSRNFGNQQVGGSSTSLAFTLSNTGSATMTISSISVSGDYSQSNNCTGSLAPSTSCTINVSFTPTATGTRTGTLSVVDNASGSPHTAGVTGVGVQGLAVFAPTSLNFGNQTINVTSSQQSFTITNNGTGALTFSSIVASGDYAQSNNCPVSPSSLAVSSSCTVQVTFTPTALGSRSGNVTITSNGIGSPQTVPLSGIGQPLAKAAPATALFAQISLLRTEEQQ